MKSDISKLFRGGVCFVLSCIGSISAIAQNNDQNDQLHVKANVFYAAQEVNSYANLLNETFLDHFGGGVTLFVNDNIGYTVTYRHLAEKHSQEKYLNFNDDTIHKINTRGSLTVNSYCISVILRFTGHIPDLPVQSYMKFGFSNNKHSFKGHNITEVRDESGVLQETIIYQDEDHVDDDYKSGMEIAFGFEFSLFSFANLFTEMNYNYVFSGTCMRGLYLQAGIQLNIF